jgi:AcrR family transcriptional regulator
MGTRERQDRERETVRAAILTAARELFVAEGYRNVSMRKIAERIEYSPAAIYSYFPGKDDIFFALAEEGFRRLCDCATAVDTAELDPLEALRACFWTYYQFSREQPQYFELMFVDRTVPQISREWDRFAFIHELMDDTAGIIRRGIDAGIFPAATNPDVAFHVLWAAVHGPAVLALCERLDPRENADALARDTLEAAIAGVRSGFVATFNPERCPVRAAVSAGVQTNATS